MTIESRRIVDEPPKGFTPTLALAWIDGVLYQKWVDWGSVLWIRVPTYSTE